LTIFWLYIVVFLEMIVLLFFHGSNNHFDENMFINSKSIQFDSSQYLTNFIGYDEVKIYRFYSLIIIFEKMILF